MLYAILIVSAYGMLVSWLYVGARVRLGKLKDQNNVFQDQIKILKEQRDNNITTVDDADSMWDDARKQ